MTQSGVPLVEISNLEFSYGRLQVLFGVSFHVDPGEALALLGTNGAGKSTVLRLLAGLNHPSSGQILFDGHDITAVPAEKLVSTGLSLVTGGRAVFADLTVRENLDIQSVPIRKDRKLAASRTAMVLQAFPALADRMPQRAGSLSGGEQQQLALAKALLLEPKVLCIDELSLGLAPVVVQALLAIIKGLRDRGMTLIVVEQSLNVAADICERAVFMEKGAVRFEGPTRDLLARDDIARAVFLGGAAKPAPDTPEPGLSQRELPHSRPPVPTANGTQRGSPGRRSAVSAEPPSPAKGGQKRPRPRSQS